MNYSKKDFIDNIDKINNDFSKDENQAYDFFKKNWLKAFILSDLERNDKIDIIAYSNNIINKFKPLSESKIEKKLFQLVSKRKYNDALKLCEYISYKYPENKEYIRSLVKQRDIYFIFSIFDMHMGGLENTVLTKSNYLVKQGYNVTIINTGQIKNYDYLLDYYRKENKLSPNIEFYNIYDYFSKKNTVNEPAPSSDESMSNSTKSSFRSDDCTIEKISNTDNSITLKYYHKDSNESIKNEIYVEDSLIYMEDNDMQKYYTTDGFNYITRDLNTRKIFLKDRQTNASIEFKSKRQFLYHFLNEVCLKSEEKPFIICESTRHWYNINKITLKDAFKIGSLHGNPFIEGNPDKGVDPKVNHLQKLHLFDKVVLLTSNLKNDLIPQYDSNKLTVIPNFLLDNQFEYGSTEKDLNQIGIFSRIDPIKQIDHSILAFKKVLDKRNDVKLNIYGSSLSEMEKEELERLKNLVDELDLNNHIEFKGYSSDVMSEMEKVLFSLFTSKTEGLPIALIESMACSTPVISYNFKYGPNDIITNNVDGIIVDKDDIEGLAESMIYLLDNPEKAIEMGKSAKEKVRNTYSVHAVGKLWEDLFIDIFIEDEIEDYLESITAEEKMNRYMKKNEKLKGRIDKLSRENRELKKFKSDIYSSKFWKIKKIFNRLFNLKNRG